MRVTHPVWAVLITAVAMLAQVIIGTAPVTLLLERDNVLYRPLGMIGITLASLGLVHLIRRLGRQPWRGVGLTGSRRAPLHLLLGALAGMAGMAAANALSVAVGVAAWQPWEMVTAGLPYLPLAIAFALLSQAFPEELLWRGHLFDTLSGRLTPPVVLAVVSIGFGAMHLISQSAADTPVERLLYVGQAAALGFACAAARARTGALWAAVGVHTGSHIANMLLPTRDITYGVQIVIMIATLSATGLLILAGRRRNGTAAGDGTVRTTAPPPSRR
ncbi:CPBP family intramembrane glutamic endopeptidase [Streptosporangium sp. NPDC048047]|uniref:CPBP family intramembrane glutamic endopeptidase n=1 Tax=Streptosporangium sp. NPDC048047 TaxID=3155748 RepID=UPI0034227F0C